MTDKPRLIEVAFPLKQASLASVHEKNVRHGHISTLHIWPARRPLAACRAALLATLLPDPGDPVKRAELLNKIGGKVTTKYVNETDADGREVAEKKDVLEGGILAWGNESDDAMNDFRAAIHAEFPDGSPRVLDPFAGGGAIPLEAMRLGCRVTASDLNPVAWFILKSTLDYPQRFAGQKWPLPEFARQWPDFIEDFLGGKVRKRKGAKRAHFTDSHQPQLDPAKISPDAEAPSEKTSACFDGTLNEATLAWHVRAWGRWVLERARGDLAARYPEHGGEPTVAYLHARTARDKITTARIPLLKTFWLCKKAGKRAALLPVPLADRSGVEFRLLGERELANPAGVIAENPQLADWEVNPETLPSFLGRGTMNRSGVWCPASGRPGMIALTMNDLRRQGQQGLLGMQMTAVVVEATVGKKTRKRYRLPTDEELRATIVEQEELDEVFDEIPFGIPNEPTPAGGGSGASRAFALHIYGMKRWRDLFSPRQLLALGVFVQHTRRGIRELRKLYPDQPDIVEGIAAGLVITFGRFVDYMSLECRWESKNGEIKNTFSRFAMPMIWDVAEANPFTASARFYVGGLEVACRVIEHLLLATASAESPSIRCQSALEGNLNASFDAVMTDPPYYDAIPYSDLMDYFLVWQKRIVCDLDLSFSKLLQRDTGPKWDSEKADGELIDDETRFGGNKKASKDSYENGMARAFSASLASLTPGGRMVVVFANKDVEAWETLIGGLIKGGATVTASWPIQTEMPNKVTQTRANLSTSVWIVCRKRPVNAGSGWDKTVLDQMRDTLFNPRETLGGRNILQYFFDLGIRGPDFLWAALGPALEAYSANSFVKKQAGGTMTVAEFLQQVRRLVLQFSLGELPGFREVSREISGRGESLDLDPVTQYYLLHRAFFGLDAAPAGACILYANGCGLNETALKLVWQILEQGRGKKDAATRSAEDAESNEDESKGNEYRLVDWRARAQRDGLGESRAGQPAPLIDRLHRLMFLLSGNRAAEVQECFENWGLAAEPAFLPLIQALHSLADRETRAEEKKLIEALAAQLKLNRRTVVNAGVVSEEPTLTGWSAGVGREAIPAPAESQ
jgi:putative DNA methylase